MSHRRKPRFLRKKKVTVEIERTSENPSFGHKREGKSENEGKAGSENQVHRLQKGQWFHAPGWSGRYKSWVYAPADCKDLNLLPGWCGSDGAFAGGIAVYTHDQYGNHVEDFEGQCKKAFGELWSGWPVDNGLYCVSKRGVHMRSHVERLIHRGSTICSECRVRET